MTKKTAHATLRRFCTDHLGVDIARGDNYSAAYDVNSASGGEKGKKQGLIFDVENQCAPNGIYLPFEACVRGFGRVAGCEAKEGRDMTAGGEGSWECLGFGMEVEGA